MFRIGCERWLILSENKRRGFLVRSRWFLAAGFDSHVFLFFETTGNAQYTGK
jgi:hypothetical protein